MSAAKRKLTPPELAELWGVGVGKVLNLIRSGELRAINLASRRSGRPRYAIDLDDVQAFERSRLVEPDGGACVKPRAPHTSHNHVREYF